MGILEVKGVNKRFGGLQALGGRKPQRAGKLGPRNYWPKRGR